VSELDETEASGEEVEERIPNTPVISYQMLALAFFIMAIPAAIPLIVIIEPSAVPFVPEVDPDESSTYLFLCGLSAVMLLANWTIVYVVWRWLIRYAAESDHDQ
jgi:hypothetical protein